ncbi:unnamed protein product [Rotaria sp. Silwood2]|nr:unnamed protein product [Rotaria sp. Silwood2]
MRILSVCLSVTLGTKYHSRGTSDHFGGTKYHSRSTSDHFYGTKYHGHGTRDHFGDTSDHFGGTSDHFGGTKYHGRGTRDHFDGTSDHFDGTKYHSRGTSDHFGGIKYHSRSTSEHFYGTSDHFGGTSDHFGGTKYHSRGTNDHLHGTSDHTRGRNDHFFHGTNNHFRGTKYHRRSTNDHFHVIELLQCSKSSPVATNEFSTIEHLIINHEISIDQLPILLSYVPQLRHLSIGNLKEPKFNRAERGSISLNYLINVSLKLHNINFDDFEILVIIYFRQIQILTIAIQYIGFYGNSTQYLNADRWEQLISTHMLNLQHQWFFDHHYHQIIWSNAAIFYSRNPYRKDYVLYDELVENIWSSRFGINEDPIHHICIHGKNMIKESIDHFPNATILTFCETFEVCCDSIAIDLNRSLPLKQLTKLTIECHRFSFEQLIKLLQFTPNVHVLKLDSILLYRTDSVSIQQNELSKLVSNMNTITKVTISKEITLEKIQLLTTIFLRMEYLTINLYKQDLQPKYCHSSFWYIHHAIG